MRGAAAALLLAGLAAVVPSAQGPEQGVVRQRVRAATGGRVLGPGDVVITIPPRALSRDTTVQVRLLSSAPKPMAIGDLLQPAVRVDLGTARLTAPAVLQFPLSEDVLSPSRQPELLSVASYDERFQTWIRHRGTVDRARRVITVAADHFSIWAPLKVVLGRVTDAARRLWDVVWQDVGVWSAPPPACDPPSHLWKVTTEGGDAVRVCAEASGTPDYPTTIRVSSNRSYPQLLNIARRSRQGDPLYRVVEQQADTIVEAAWQLIGRQFPFWTYLPAKGVVSIGQREFGGCSSCLRADPHMYAILADLAISMKVEALSGGIEDAIEAGECVLNRMFDHRDLFEDRTRAGSSLRAAYKMLKDCLAVFLEDEPKVLVRALRDLIEQAPPTLDLLSRGLLQDRTVVKVARQPMLPFAATDGTRLPQAVRRTTRALYDLVKDSSGVARKDWDRLHALKPAAGLLFEAADGRTDSATLSLSPRSEPAAKLAALLTTPPAHGSCPGRSPGYVFGVLDERDPAVLGRLGYTTEEAKVIRGSVRDAQPYKACISDDGEWRSLLAEDRSWVDTAAALPVGQPPARPLCPEVPNNPLVPLSATCLSVIEVDLDGNQRQDRLLLYRYIGHHGHVQVARAVLDDGTITDLTNPPRSHPTLPRDPPRPLGVHDLDGDGGQEVLVGVDHRDNTDSAVAVTLGHQRNLRLVNRQVDPFGSDTETFYITLGGGVQASNGLECVDITGDRRPELVVLEALRFLDPYHFFDRRHLERHELWTWTRVHYKWRGKTLVPLRERTGLLRGRPPPRFWDVHCPQPTPTSPLPPGASSPEAAALAVLNAWQAGDRAAAAAYVGVAWDFPQDVMARLFFHGRREQGRTFKLKQNKCGRYGEPGLPLVENERRYTCVFLGPDQGALHLEVRKTLQLGEYEVILVYLPSDNIFD